jgi:hypothetical protein
MAGLAAAIVPCAVVVHLVAEAAALGHEAFGFGFIVRHAYFGGLVLAAAWWFCLTVGLGRPDRERRRRCALVRAELGGARRARNLTGLVVANLGFFALTQGVEGIPIASGAVGLGLGAALAGSLLCALLVVLFGRSIAAAGLAAVIGITPLRRAPAAPARRRRVRAVPRNATAVFSLFVPNRPPPAAFSI